MSRESELINALRKIIDRAPKEEEDEFDIGQYIIDIEGIADKAINGSENVVGSGDEVCHSCGRSNPIWSAENDLWNEVNGSPAGIICPTCFGEAAKWKGVDVYFRATREIPSFTITQTP